MCGALLANFQLDVLDPLVFIDGCLLYLKGGLRRCLTLEMPSILFIPKFSYNSCKLLLSIIYISIITLMIIENRAL